MHMKKPETLYIGGYQGQNTRCLYAYNYDTQKKSFEKLESYEIVNTTYLCFSPDKRYLYAVIEVDNYKGHTGGGVAAFAVGQEGRLHFLNDNFTEGGAPCHLSVSADGKTLYAVNYHGGSTIIFDLLPSGEIGNKKILVNHKYLGSPSHYVTGRQEMPHAHYVQPVYIGAILTLWVCDLGLDAVLVLNESGDEAARFQTPPGFGPRHLAFHPILPLAYIVGELACAVITLEYGFDGTVLLIKASQEIPVLENDYIDTTCAAIRVSPERNHLLVSNRKAGDEGSISVLCLDASGKITGLKMIVPSSGYCPRDFAFNPAGDKVFVAHEDSDKVDIFDWSQERLLTHTGKAFNVQKPACILL